MGCASARLADIPAAGWGTVDNLMDPVWSSRAFYGGPDGPNHGSPRGLLDIDGQVVGLRDMHAQGVIGDWDGPYPMLDVSGNLQQAGEDPTSVDSYVKKYELSVGEFDGGTHNPLYDSAVAAAA